MVGLSSKGNLRRDEFILYAKDYFIIETIYKLSILISLVFQINYFKFDVYEKVFKTVVDIEQIYYICNVQYK